MKLYCIPFLVITLYVGLWFLSKESEYSVDALLADQSSDNVLLCCRHLSLLRCCLFDGTARKLLNHPTVGIHMV